MPLFARTFQELMTDSLEELGQNTKITRLGPGSMARSLLESVNKRLSESYDIFDLNLARAFVSSAPGQYLDLIGALLDVQRQSSVAANVSLDTEILKWYVESGTFGDINGGNPITIPQGTIISSRTAGKGVLYRTLTETVLPANSNSEWFSAEAVVPGEEAHVGTDQLVYHTFANYTDYANASLLVRNVHPIANGKNFENDENFRYRIVNRALEAEAGNETAIRLAVLSTPGVADVLILPRYRGISTCGVIIKSVLPTVSQTLLDDVTVNVNKVKSVGDEIFVRKPFETGISLRLTVHYFQRMTNDEISSVEESIEERITEFVNSLDIGEPLFVNRMISNLFGIDSNISNFGEPGELIDEIYVHKESQLRDNRVRQTLLGDYTPDSDERIIIEPSLSTPIVLARAYTRS